MIKVTLLLCSLLLCPISVQDENVQVYAKELNLWASAFLEPYEILYILFENGDLYGFTTKDEGKVNVPVSWICEFLEERGHTMNDAIYIIHNHFADPKFSPRNMKTMYELRERGFRGVFAMLDTATGKIICLRSDDG